MFNADPISGRARQRPGGLTSAARHQRGSVSCRHGLPDRRLRTRPRRLDEAEAALARLDARGLPPSLAAVAELTAAELALRSLRIGPARAALARAHEAAGRARVPALQAEVEEARAALDRPAARRLF